MKKNLLIILFTTFCLVQASVKFKTAKVGQYYEIKGNSSLALLLKPEVSIVASENKRNMITELGASTYSVEIVKAKGIVDRFFYVNIISYGKIKLRGWIWYGGVSSATKISRNKAYAENKSRNYTINEEEKRRLNAFMKNIEKEEEEALGKSDWSISFVSENFKLGFKQVIIDDHIEFFAELENLTANNYKSVWFLLKGQYKNNKENFTERVSFRNLNPHSKKISDVYIDEELLNVQFEFLKFSE